MSLHIMDNENTSCAHHYTDFDWYMKYSQEEVIVKHFLKKEEKKTRYKIELIEPYVCIHCGHRMDKVLNTWYADDRYERDELLQNIAHEYENLIKPKPIIEDKINDMLLVDREYLDLWKETRGQS